MSLGDFSHRPAFHFCVILLNTSIHAAISEACLEHGASKAQHFCSRNEFS